MVLISSPIFFGLLLTVWPVLAKSFNNQCSNFISSLEIISIDKSERGCRKFFDKATNRYYFLKGYSRMEREGLVSDGYLNELNVLKTLQTAKIPGIFDHVCDFKSSSHSYTLVESRESIQTLADFMVSSTNGIWAKLVILYQIKENLKQIHEARVVHNDVKPHNILVDVKTGIIYMADFDLSCRMDDEECFPRGGTFGYYSPPYFCLIRRETMVPGIAEYCRTRRNDVNGFAGTILYIFQAESLSKNKQHVADARFAPPFLYEDPLSKFGANNITLMCSHQVINGKYLKADDLPPQIMDYVTFLMRQWKLEESDIDMESHAIWNTEIMKMVADEVEGRKLKGSVSVNLLDPPDMPLHLFERLVSKSLFPSVIHIER